MKAIFLGVLLMVISPLLFGCSCKRIPERARQGKPGVLAERFYTCYVGLGDSISIDEYAGGPGWGAISLFHRNKDAIYPEWKGKTFGPSIRE